MKTTTSMKWLVDRMLVEEYDSNKQYASEVRLLTVLRLVDPRTDHLASVLQILAILLQQSRSNRLQLAKLSGIDVLLRVLSVRPSPLPHAITRIS